MTITRVGSQSSAKGPADWFTGTVRIDSMFQREEPARIGGAVVTFEPGARTAWHTHPLGQTLIVTSGCGWVQCEGGPIVLKGLQHQAHMRTASSDERLFAFSHEMFAHIAEYRKVFRAMVGKRSDALVQQLLQKIVVDLVRDDLKAIAGRGDDRSAPAEAVVQFVAGGFFALAMLWAAGRLPLSVEEVNTLFRRLAMLGVKATLR
jgi:tetracycline repressor-like protein